MELHYLRIERTYFLNCLCYQGIGRDELKKQSNEGSVIKDTRA